MDDAIRSFSRVQGVFSSHEDTEVWRNAYTTQYNTNWFDVISSVVTSPAFDHIFSWLIIYSRVITLSWDLKTCNNKCRHSNTWRIYATWLNILWRYTGLLQNTHVNKTKEETNTDVHDKRFMTKATTRLFLKLNKVLVRWHS